jgi:sugar/nucleoside kinase (ribokinase family)
MPVADVQSRFAFEQASQRRFTDYHAENPQVYEALRRFALEARRAGRPRLSINMLFERVRWQTTVEGKGDSFKLNNSHRAFYSRLLMEQEPELRGFFETRKAKADAA